MAKLKKVLVGCVSICMVVALPLAHAQAPTSEAVPKWHATGQRIQAIYSQLHLTQEQKKQLEANKQQHRLRMDKARQEIKIDKEDLKEELMKPQLDMSKIRRLHQQVKDLLAQMEDIKLSSILAVRAILTADQFSQFVNLMHKYKQEHAQ